MINNCKHTSLIILTELVKANKRYVYSYYHLTKKLHTNATKPNYRKLSEAIDCSVNALKSNIKVLKQMGYVYFIGDNLHFRSTREFKTSKTTYCKEQNKIIKRNAYKQFTSKNILESKLEIDNFLAISNSLHKQEIILRIKSTNTKNVRKRKSLNGYEVDYVGLSQSTVGKNLGKSRNTGARLIKKLKDLNLLKVTAKYNFIDNMTKEEFKYSRNEFLIPQWSKFNQGVVIAQGHSEMKAFKELFCSLKKKVRIKKEKTLSIYIVNVPWFGANKPKDYISRADLRRQGYNEKQIKTMFIKEGEACTKGFGSRNYGLMTIISFNRAKDNQTTNIKAKGLIVVPTF